MGRVQFGLISVEGDRLGHLVRGVQMLRSYGDEAVVRRTSPVVYPVYRTDWSDALCCTLECDSDASPEELEAMRREVEWALGENPLVLTVRYARPEHGETLPEPFPDPGSHDLAAGTQVFFGADDFTQLYDWGQVSLHEESLIGEWPSAASEG